MSLNTKNRKIVDLIIFLLIIAAAVYLGKSNEPEVSGRDPLVGIGYNLEYKHKIFPDISDEEIDEITAKILDEAKSRARKGELFKVTEDELEKLGITGLDPSYLHMIKISTE